MEGNIQEAWKLITRESCEPQTLKKSEIDITSTLCYDCYERSRYYYYF